MFVFQPEDKELIRVIRQYNQIFERPLFSERELQKVENEGFCFLGLPNVDKEKLISKIEEAIRTRTPLDLYELFYRLAGCPEEIIKAIKEGEILF